MHKGTSRLIGWVFIFVLILTSSISLAQSKIGKQLPSDLIHQSSNDIIHSFLFTLLQLYSTRKINIEQFLIILQALLKITQTPVQSQITPPQPTSALEKKFIIEQKDSMKINFSISQPNELKFVYYDKENVIKGNLINDELIFLVRPEYSFDQQVSSIYIKGILEIDPGYFKQDTSLYDLVMEVRFVEGLNNSYYKNGKIGKISSNSISFEVSYDFKNPTNYPIGYLYFKMKMPLWESLPITTPNNKYSSSDSHNVLCYFSQYNNKIFFNWENCPLYPHNLPFPELKILMNKLLNQIQSCDVYNDDCLVSFKNFEINSLRLTYQNGVKEEIKNLNYSYLPQKILMLFKNLAKLLTEVKQIRLSIKVIYPNGGEIIEWDQPTIVQYESSNVEKVTIKLTNIRNLITRQLVKDAYPSGYFIWKPIDYIDITELRENNFSICIEGKSKYGQLVEDCSDGHFGIINTPIEKATSVPAFITSSEFNIKLLYPNGGEIWKLNNYYKVKYDLKLPPNEIKDKYYINIFVIYDEETNEPVMMLSGAEVSDNNELEIGVDKKFFASGKDIIKCRALIRICKIGTSNCVEDTSNTFIISK